jgi:hypothetical protein
MSLGHRGSLGFGVRRHWTFPPKSLKVHVESIRSLFKYAVCAQGGKAKTTTAGWVKLPMEREILL